MSLAQQSGLILAARVGKHTDELLLELVVSTEGKMTCQDWNTDGWGGYERVLPETVDHCIGKALSQRVERTNGILRQQTGRWHRRQNEFGKRWHQAIMTARLIVGYFNWIWCPGLQTTAAQRAGLATHRWSWDDLVSYPTLL